MAGEAETFLERKLRPDLEAALRRRQDVLDNIADLDELKKTVALLHRKSIQSSGSDSAGASTSSSKSKSSSEKYKQLVDVGAEHFVVAEADVIDRIFLKIGLGFLLEVTLQEAPPLIDQQKAVLEKCVLRLQ